MWKRINKRQLDFQLVQLNKERTKQVPATLQSVQYKCLIINNILKTTLTQTFQSKSENEYSETQYLFPIEENICLESFVAKFNEKTIRGIVKGKEEAEKEYQDNKDQGNFVSYASKESTPREEQIKIKLGNLPPGQQVEIVLTFSQQLNSIMNKYYVAYIPFQYVEDEISVKMGKNVLTLDLFCTGKITYSNSKGYPAEKVVVDDNTARFTLSQAFLQKDMDFQLIFSYEGMFEPQIILGSSNVYHEDSVKRALLPISNSAMVSFIPNFNKEHTQELDDTIRAAINNGDDILSDQFQQKLNEEFIDHLNSSRSEFIFLIDRSGSMSGKPIQKACEALVLFLQSLPNDSYFNVVGFGSYYQKLFPSSRKYTSETLKLAISQVNTFQGNLGGTEIYTPLKYLFQKKNRIQGYNKQIFLLTDGEVNHPENVIKLIKKNNKFSRVHSIGFGSGADKFLIEQSSVAGKGISKIIDLNSDLSQVIINILSSCITPTYDEFSITYDQSIFDSTYPISTKFPCVFKDDIINIHFFFKPLIELSSLNEAQKTIQIQYYDSQQKQKVTKEIKLKMQDCFTCNAQLQESVFKLGKQMYLNETISSSKNQGSELLQQALDFQLLTEKTALICVIETLNDEQKIMFQNIQTNKTYSNLQTRGVQINQSPYNIPPPTRPINQIYQNNTMKNNFNNNQRNFNNNQRNYTSIQRNYNSNQSNFNNNQSNFNNKNQNCNSNNFLFNFNNSNQQFQSSQNDLLLASAYSDDNNNNKLNALDEWIMTSNIQATNTLNNMISDHNLQEPIKQKQKIMNENYIKNNNNLNNQNQMNSKQQKNIAEGKNYSINQHKYKRKEQNYEPQMNNGVFAQQRIRSTKKSNQLENKYNNEKNFKQYQQYSSDDDEYDCNWVCDEQQVDSRQYLSQQQKNNSSDRFNSEFCKNSLNVVQFKGNTDVVKLEFILNKVDNLGTWVYDEKLIQQFAPKLGKQIIQEFMVNFKQNDAFMTLFILCILELSFISEKSKWTLIAKKSTSYLKQNIKEGKDFSTLKQMILSAITN